MKILLGMLLMVLLSWACGCAQALPVVEALAAIRATRSSAEPSPTTQLQPWMDETQPGAAEWNQMIRARQAPHGQIQPWIVPPR